MTRGMTTCTGHKHWKIYYHISTSVHFLCSKESIDIRVFFLWSSLLTVLKYFISAPKTTVLSMHHKVHSNLSSRHQRLCLKVITVMSVWDVDQILTTAEWTE